MVVFLFSVGNSSNAFLVLKLDFSGFSTVDIFKDESAEAALKTVMESTDSLDGIVNFAGIMQMGSVAENPVESMRRIMDINLLGMYRINRAFLELIRKGQGRIVNISSEYGTLNAVPFNGFYTTSKHAVETYSDALRRELMFLGVPVIKVRPGAFQTNMQGNTASTFDKTVKDSTMFPEVLAKMHTMMEKKIGIAKDPVFLAKKVYKALTSKKPRLVYSANLNKQQKFMSCLPARLQDMIYYSLFK